MKDTTGRILKKNQVRLEGKLRLELDGPGAANTAAAGSATARIVKTDPQFALVEITCGCGRKTYLRCEYAGHRSPAAVAGSQGDETAAGPQVKTQEQ